MRFIVFFLSLIISVSVFAQAESKSYKSFDGSNIVYTDEGDGKVVLILHGFINTRKSFDASVIKEQLLSAGYRVIIPDQRGNGDSDKPHDDESYANDAEVKDLLGLMSHIQVKKYYAIGYSRGSIVLAKLLTRDRRIKKAVLGGMGLDFTNPDWDIRKMFAAGFDGKTAEYPITKGAVDYATSIGADLRALHLLQKHQPAASIEALEKVKAKILVVKGDEDDSNGSAPDLKAVFRKSKLILVPGDHNTTYRKAPFAEAVMGWL